MAYQSSGRNWATIWVMTMAVSVHILKVDNNMMNQISEGFPKFGCFIFPKKLSNISLHHYVKTIFNYS